ncbi:hypothetical protein MDA_GLEAN10025540 [Myotis davidii]|uniref:Uncharacterized protein n=1 Tax=Myotis davidii TaxID=225400 RepID=L5LMV4_MYODS|nr:hypothetical protein MDA_GLEAN10025540 [Myotis davidii]
MAVSRAERVVEQDKGDFRGMPGLTSSEEESPAVRTVTSEVVPSQRSRAARGRGCRRGHAALVCRRLAYPYAQVSRERNKSRGSLSLASQTFRWRQKTTLSVDTVRRRRGLLAPRCEGSRPGGGCGRPARLAERR